MEYHSGGSLPLLGRPRYCPGANTNRGYLCETGHCCGETGCCTYYYELWWFWLLWTALILFSCCCAYRHRRAKLRVQQQQRQREISLLAYHGASSYPSSMLDLSFLASLKLPSYEEVAAQPSTPPPPYSSVFTTPRYPQPPRAVDPHLLTQHGPLLHQALSDGPSSLSSDNSSSCSCDSCCPSSPCSSSLSAPVTYETDTSHASTPSEATPLTLDVTIETITAAATCLNEVRLSSEKIPSVMAADVAEADAAGTPPITTSSPAPNQLVTVAVVTRAASPQPPSSPGAELPVGTTSPVRLDRAPTERPTPPAANIQAQAWDPRSAPPPETTSVSGPQTPSAAAPPGSRTAGSPSSVSPPDFERTLALTKGSAGPTLSPLDPLQEPECVPSKLPQAPDSGCSDLIVDPQPKTTRNLILTPGPARSDLTLVSEAAPTSLPSAQCHDPKVSLGPDPPSPGSGLSQTSGSVAGSLSLCGAAGAGGSGPPLVLSQSPVSVLITPLHSDVQAGSGSGSCSVVDSRSGPLSAPPGGPPLPTPAHSPCPAITIESESSFATSPLTPTGLSPSSPPSLPSPPLPTSHPAPALLLDPLNALQQSDRGGSSSGHASSLSPSPRATQSPPKQTLFSPCVDIFEAGPVTWEDEEEQQEEKDNEEDEEEDVGADESQYRHRRLTGDSGIEVCRCRVEEEDDEEEEAEERKEDGRRGGGGGGGDKKGGNSGFHDSVDCPARGQLTTEEGLTLCTPTTASTPTSEDSGKVVIVMETV